MLKEAVKKMSEREDYLSKGKVKMTVADVIARYPNGITMKEVEVTEYQGNKYPVFTIKEDDSVYINGGKAIMEIVNAWKNELGVEDCVKINELLTEEDFKFKFEQIKTKSGRNFTKVIVVE